MRISTMAVGAALAALAVTACGGLTASSGSTAVDGARPGRQAHVTSTTWPTRLVLRNPLRLGIASQAFDARSGTDYALTFTRGQSVRLRVMSVRGGPARLGPTFPVQQIKMAEGWIWIYGVQARPHRPATLMLYQVNRSTLRIVRTWKLGPSVGAGYVAVAPGGNGTVWAGFRREIWQIKARSGVIVRRTEVPAGLTVGDVAIAPSGRYLYASANTRLGQGTIVEFSTRTGHVLAINNRGVVRFSIGAAQVTAVPDGVWVAFRTGNLGRTVLLRQRDLRSVPLPGQNKRGSLFSWAMFASTLYAGHALFLARDDGIIGCVNPRTGFVRARGTVAGLVNTGLLLTSGAAGRVLYGTGTRGIIAINPPAACYR